MPAVSTRDRGIDVNGGLWPVTGSGVVADVGPGRRAVDPGIDARGEVVDGDTGDGQRVVDGGAQRAERGGDLGPAPVPAAPNAVSRKWARSEVWAAAIICRGPGGAAVAVAVGMPVAGSWGT